MILLPAEPRSVTLQRARGAALDVGAAGAVLGVVALACAAWWNSVALLAFGVAGLLEAGAAALAMRALRESATPRWRGRTSRRGVRVIRAARIAVAAVLLGLGVAVFRGGVHVALSAEALFSAAAAFTAVIILARRLRRAHDAVRGRPLGVQQPLSLVSGRVAAIVLGVLAVQVAAGWPWTDATTAIAMAHALTAASVSRG